MRAQRSFILRSSSHNNRSTSLSIHTLPEPSLDPSSTYFSIMSTSSTNNTNAGAFETPKDNGIATGGEQPGAPKKAPPLWAPRNSYSKTLAKPGITTLLHEIVDGDKSTVMNAFKKLHELVGSNNKKKKKMREVVCGTDGAATKFTAALADWTGVDVNVVAVIFRVISALSMHFHEDFDRAMLSTGLLKAMVVALGEHKQRQGVQRCGIRLLRNATTRKETAKYLVEEHSAHEDILGVMAAFPNDFQMQLDGFDALRSLLRQGAAFTDKKAAHKTIKRAIQKYHKSSELVTLGLEFLD